MTSKQVLDDGKIAAGLIEAAYTHAPEIAKRRAAQYAALKVKGAPTANAIESQIHCDAAVLNHRLTELRRDEREPLQPTTLRGTSRRLSLSRGCRRRSIPTHPECAIDSTSGLSRRRQMNPSST